MEIRRVRLYRPKNSNGDVVGISASLAEHKTAIRGYFVSNGYEVQEVGPHTGSHSKVHLEVVPPLSDDAVKAFGRFMLGDSEALGLTPDTAIFDNRTSHPESLVERPSMYGLQPVLGQSVELEQVA